MVNGRRITVDPHRAVNGIATTGRVADGGDRSRSAVIVELVTVKTGYINVVLPTLQRSRLGIAPARH
jgi:hypothetical protein